jgi:hypothetical protein
MEPRYLGERRGIPYALSASQPAALMSRPAVTVSSYNGNPALLRRSWKELMASSNVVAPPSHESTPKATPEQFS